MIIEGLADKRTLRTVQLQTDLVVVGGGMTGVCCAVTAARAGIRVVLLQDRPVLGGNASSEIRVWSLGATSHMGNNNRWSREGGLINEILTENTYRNREGNPVLFDTVLLDLVLAEPGITLCLNTSVFALEKSDASHLKRVKGYNSASETFYDVEAKFFADCSGDGVISCLAGVPYRVGAEEGSEFSEGFAPDREEYGEVMGHSIFFYMKDTGHPVTFVKPGFALDDVERYISKIDNNEYFSIHHHGCKYWWLEYGGRFDTVHDTERIKYELWKVVYGIWNYIKNSGKFPEMATYTLEWVGLIPGKRESRRFEGMYMLSQRDIIEQRHHYDAVAFGGWSVDLHPSDGVYASGRACNQWHSKGIYQIPYRCYLNERFENLMFGGRIISATHVANASTRVMCTSALSGQVIGLTMALCVKHALRPVDYADPERIGILQRELILRGHFIPDVEVLDEASLLRTARLAASSTYAPIRFEPNGHFETIGCSVAQLLPVRGKLPTVSVEVEALTATTLEVQLRKSSKRGNYTPDRILETRQIALHEGRQKLTVSFESRFEQEEYLFITFLANDRVRIAQSDCILTGVTTVYNQVNVAVSNYGRQDPPEGIGVESFEFWCPKRRPEAKNLALTFGDALHLYDLEHLRTACYRPFNGTNAWAADLADEDPWVEARWDAPQRISKVVLNFDVDYDHAMETVQYGHYDDVMPQCVRAFELLDGRGTLIRRIEENHQGQVIVTCPEPVETDRLRIRFKRWNRQIPVAVLGIGIY